MGIICYVTGTTTGHKIFTWLDFFEVLQYIFDSSVNGLVGSQFAYILIEYAKRFSEDPFKQTTEKHSLFQ